MRVWVWQQWQMESDLAILQRFLTALKSQTHSVATLRTHPDQITHCLHHRWGEGVREGGREREKQIELSPEGRVTESVFCWL